MKTTVGPWVKTGDTCSLSLMTLCPFVKFSVSVVSKHHLLRVVHRALLRSEGIILLGYFKARNVLLCSFFEFLVTYETQKNDAFFCVLFLRT